MIQIKFDSSSKAINSYSSLSIIMDNKNYFFNNTNSWMNKELQNPAIELEYLCLADKKDTDIITIQYNDLIYKIECSKNILINNNNILQLRVYLDFNGYKFKKDVLDNNVYDIAQNFCTHKISVSQIPLLQIRIFNDIYIFDKWYSHDNSLLFYSKDTKDKYHAYIQIFREYCVLYLVTKVDNIKYQIIYSSYSSKNQILSNELGQIDCSQIKLNFKDINTCRPIIIAPDNYYNINTIHDNISIKTL